MGRGNGHGLLVFLVELQGKVLLNVVQNFWSNFRKLFEIYGISFWLTGTATGDLHLHSNIFTVFTTLAMLCATNERSFRLRAVNSLITNYRRNRAAVTSRARRAYNILMKKNIFLSLCSIFFSRSCYSMPPTNFSWFVKDRLAALGFPSTRGDIEFLCSVGVLNATDFVDWESTVVAWLPVDTRSYSHSRHDSTFNWTSKWVS